LIKFDSIQNLIVRRDCISHYQAKVRRSSLSPNNWLTTSVSGSQVFYLALEHYSSVKVNMSEAELAPKFAPFFGMVRAQTV